MHLLLQRWTTSIYLECEFFSVCHITFNPFRLLQLVTSYISQNEHDNVGGIVRVERTLVIVKQ